MSPSDAQGELLPPTPSGGPETPPQDIRDPPPQAAPALADEIGQLKRQVRVQGTLLLGTLLALLVLSASLNLVTLKQMRMARNQLSDLRSKVHPLYRNFREQQEPVVRSLVSQLQSFAETNTSFRPVLERHRPFLQQYFTGPAAPPPLMPPLHAPVLPSQQAPP